MSCSLLNYGKIEKECAYVIIFMFAYTLHIVWSLGETKEVIVTTQQTLTLEQLRELHARVIRGIPVDIDPEIALEWIDNPKAMQQLLRNLLGPPPQDIPKLNKPFTLTQASAYGTMERRRFMLIRLPLCKSRDEALSLLRSMEHKFVQGKNPDKWLIAFRQRFPFPDERRGVIVPASTERVPSSRNFYDCYELKENDGQWTIYRYSIDSCFESNTRWLVEV
jgi:hypothetical protein